MLRLAGVCWRSNTFEVCASLRPAVQTSFDFVDAWRLERLDDGTGRRGTCYATEQAGHHTQTPYKKACSHVITGRAGPPFEWLDEARVGRVGLVPQQALPALR